MLSIGVDPGKSGAIAVLSSFGAKFIKLDSTERDVWQWCNEEIRGVPGFAFVEKVHAMPGQGVSSTFKFGTSYGFCRGILIALGVPFEEVAPGVWQRSMGCLSKGDKNVTKAKAQQLFPDVRVTHKNADALLIAEYARRTRPVEVSG